jgi:hypothetical protein
VKKRERKFQDTFASAAALLPRISPLQLLTLQSDKIPSTAARDYRPRPEK